MKSDALLTRLQAANPEPLIVLTDSFDLFNEITASPGDPRLSTSKLTWIFSHLARYSCVSCTMAAAPRFLTSATVITLMPCSLT